MKSTLLQNRAVASLAAAALLLVPSKRLLAQDGPPLTIVPFGTEVQITWPAGTNFNVLEESDSLDATNLWQDVSDAPSPLGDHYSVHTAATNSSKFYRLVQRGTSSVPTLPDPASIAPPIPPNVFAPFASGTAFLYTGPNPIQIGVVPGTIVPLQAAVLRGRVLKRDNSPLPGVRVALLNHPEFGYTYTRTDGMFDMAVNASGFTVDFEAMGYLGVHRQAQLTGQNYFMLGDVVMIGLDSMSTAVTMGSNSPAQLADSTPQIDAAGTRSAKVFFPPGTAATMVMPDGSTQPLNSMTVRVTEYTVGSNGPAAMPAPLPPSSAYTYCAEFTADEALAAGATTVQFSQQVPVYIDNFLNVPVGMLVPVGNYDRTAAAWMPWSNGIVMEVLGSSNGAALVDLHGTGTPEPANVLAANGFTTPELQQLASLYSAGKTIWRCQLPHFCPWDMNHVLSPPDPKKNDGQPQPDGNPNDNSPDNYGTLNFSQQTFTEAIPLVGEPFALHYNSARMPGYRVNDVSMVPVKYVPPPPKEGCLDNGSDDPCVVLFPYLATPPSNIRVDLQVSGEPDAVQILPESDTVANVSWDGRDAYGRFVGGTVSANITVAYQYTNWNYGGVAGGPELSAEFPDLFGNDGNFTAFAGHYATTLGIGSTFQQLLTLPDHRALGFGGWSPSVLHRFDPVGGILYYGDGRIRTVPQSALQGQYQDQIEYLQRVAAAAPDGSIYFDGALRSGNGENILFRRLPGGTLQSITVSTLVPGSVYPNGLNWSKVDGQPTSRVSLGPVDLAAMCVGPDGSVYVTDSFVIARLTPDGIWHVIAGLNAVQTAIMQPDGTPANNSYATDGGRVTMAAGPDGSLFFSGSWSSADGTTNYTPIRKIAPDGRLYTVYGATGSAASGAGTQYWYNLFGTSAFAAKGSGIVQAMAVGNDGTIYVSPNELFDGGGMFRISPGGVILPFLSAGPNTGAGAGYNPADTNNTALILGDEGKLAIDVTSGYGAADTIAVGPDGSVYFTTGFIVWRVNANGILERVAGRFGNTAYDPPNYPQDGADPLNTYLYPAEALTVTPDNTLVIVRDQTPSPFILLYPQRSSQQGLLATPLEAQDIPSEDGSEIYVFDQNGRHLSTLDSLTGAAKWTFAYDVNSLVVTITDAAGLVTHIQRAGAGNPTAIVSPYGQITTLGVDANGFLNKVTNPASESTTIASTTNGLLSSITGPLGETYSVSYDNLGRALQISDPLGGGWTDTVTDIPGNTTYTIDAAATNSIGTSLFRELIAQPDGSTTEQYRVGSNFVEYTSLALNGNESFGFGDGSSYYVSVGPDPRFGVQVPEPASLYLQLSNGLPYYSAIFQRSTALLNNGDPLSLTGLTNVSTINGNIYTQTYKPSNGTITSTTPAGRTATTVLDPARRITHVAEAGNPVFDAAYDANGRLASITNSSAIGAATTTFGYDGLGQLSLVTDPLGRSISLAYDSAGRLAQGVLPDGGVAGFTFDSEYNMTSVTPPGRPAHIFQYNSLGLITNYIPPLAGTDASVSYVYDTEREVTQIDFPDGQVAAFQYNLAGQVEQVGLGAGPTLSFNYGGPNHLQLLSVASSTGDALQYGYTGPVPTATTWSGAVTGQVMMQLNTDLLPSSLSVNGSSVTNIYDQDLLLTQVGSLNITHDPITGYVTGTSIGVVTDQRQFDDRGFLTNYTANANGSNIWSINLAFDLIGRLTNRTETINGQTQSSSYIYDAADRLQQVWSNGLLSVNYTYDTNGNRLTRNSENATYDAQDRVLTYADSTFTWSPNGTQQSRLNGGQTTDYTYDVREQLVSADVVAGQQTSYIIDEEGRRIGKKVNGMLQRGWLWNSNLVAAEVDGNSSLTAQFVYGADELTASYMITGTNTYRILSDERGSARLIVDVANGSVAQQLSYDEFGRVTADSNPGFQPFGFAGGLYDPDTGLVRFGARDYSSETGQWTARDPLRFAAGTFSLYAYVGNDPINRIDPLGTGPGPHNLVLPSFLGGTLTTRRDDIDAIITLSQKGNNNQLKNAIDNSQATVKTATTLAGNLANKGAGIVYSVPFASFTLATEGLSHVIPEVIIHQGIDQEIEEQTENAAKAAEKEKEEQEARAKMQGHE